MKQPYSQQTPHEHKILSKTIPHLLQNATLIIENELFFLSSQYKNSATQNQPSIFFYLRSVTCNLLAKHSGLSVAWLIFSWSLPSFLLRVVPASVPAGTAVLIVYLNCCFHWIRRRVLSRLCRSFVLFFPFSSVSPPGGSHGSASLLWSFAFIQLDFIGLMDFAKLWRTRGEPVRETCQSLAPRWAVRQTAELGQLFCVVAPNSNNNTRFWALQNGAGNL